MKKKLQKMSKRSNLRKNFTRSINSILSTSGDLPETLRKLCLSTESPYQKIKWNYGISCSGIDWKKTVHSGFRLWNIGEWYEHPLAGALKIISPKDKKQTFPLMFQSTFFKNTTTSVVTTSWSLWFSNEQPQLRFNCSNLIIETPGKGVKYVQS